MTKVPTFLSYSPYVRLTVDATSGCQFANSSSPGGHSYGNVVGTCPYTGCLGGNAVSGGGAAADGYWSYN
jgi:hypothetical protein